MCACRIFSVEFCSDVPLPDGPARGLLDPLNAEAHGVHTSSELRCRSLAEPTPVAPCRLSSWLLQHP